MRWFFRFVGLWIAACAFVAVIIDGARSIADNALRTETIGALWASLDGASLSRLREAVERDLSPVVLDNLIEPILNLPLFLLLALIAALFLIAGRRPRSRIGYAVRGG
jgi:hypothetical protein